MDRDKKLRAAVSGVLSYLHEEQAKRTVISKVETVNQPGNWAFYSRQMTMINRDRLQRRIVKR